MPEFPPSKCHECVDFRWLACVAARGALGEEAEIFFGPHNSRPQTIDPVVRERIVRKFQKIGCVHPAVLELRNSDGELQA